MEGKDYDVIIVGGASAGLTSALYSSRQGLKTLVVTKDIGGQALLTDSIENYPGILSTGGFELMNSFKNQAEKYGAEFVFDEIKQINRNDDGYFEVSTSRSGYRSLAVILAFGKTPRDLGVPGEEEFKNKGVSYCSICDGPLYRDKTVAIAGVGMPAIDAGILMKDIASKVFLVFPSGDLVGDGNLVEQLKSSNRVEMLSHSEITEIKGDKRIRSIVVRNSGNSTEREIEVDGLFVEMGYVTKTEFLRDLLDLNKLGEIVTDKEGHTSVEGIFAAGDVTDIGFKQVVISAGAGAIAALSAYNYVQKVKGLPASRNDWKKLSSKKESDTGVSLFLH